MESRRTAPDTEDAETDALVRQLATARNLTYTAAIRLAVSNELARPESAPVPGAEQEPAPARRPIDLSKIDEIVQRWKAYPPLDMKEVDEWLYDENGLPH